MKFISRMVSLVFHPLIIPTLGLLLIFNVGTHFSYLPVAYQRVVYLVVFLSTFILPLSIIPLFLLIGVIKSVHMSDRRERLWPVFFTSVFYFIGYYFLKRLQFVPTFIELFVFSSLLTIYAAMAITLFWKISMHMIGIGGLTAALLVLAVYFPNDLFFPFLLVLITAGIIGVSRLYLNAHRPQQVYLGFILGFAVVFLGVILRL